MSRVNLSENVIDAANAYGRRPALLLGDEEVTYEQLDGASAALTGWLIERGVGEGDAVGLMLPNIPEFAIAYYAVLRAGGVVVPMNVLLKEREASFYLEDSGARLLLVWDEFAGEALRGAARAGAECVQVSSGSLAELSAGATPYPGVRLRAGSDTAVVLYTSGTTGTPKGAELTHANLLRNIEVCIATLLKIGPSDVVLGALPLFHSFGQTCGLNSAVAAGAALALVPRFDPTAVLQTIQRRGVTVFEGVPTMYFALLGVDGRDGFDVSSLRCCVSGGAALPAEVLRSFEAAFGCIVLEGYGLSETSPVACFNHPDRERIPGSIGTPIEGVEMRVVDEQRCEVEPGVAGEIAIRGHNVMKGYLRRPEATAEAIDTDGWFYTGDIGRVDVGGVYSIVDRKKEMIIRGGYNVYPREIEEVLYEHPAVREAAVIGVPHVELGEEVAAAVAVEDLAVTTAELRDYVKATVAAYKYPRHLWIVDELPKTATGKIRKQDIEVPREILGTVEEEVRS